MELYSTGISYDEIGKYMDRSGNAIKLRLESIVYDNLVKGKSVNILTKMLNTNTENIKKLYYSYKSFKESRGDNVQDVDFKDELPINTNIGGSFVNTNIKKDINLEKVEYENKIMEAIIRNYKMKKDVRKLYIDDKLDEKSKKLFDKIIK
jgi:hypothetical protein